MSNFVGRHLEEMADIRATRKCKLVRLCSLLSLCVLFGYSLAYIAYNEHVLASINLICCFILALNLWHIHRHRQLNYSDLVLTAVLMFQALILLLYNERFPDRLMWVFPIMAGVILINEFKVGLLFSFVFCTLSIASGFYTDAIVTQIDQSHERFILSLIVTCAICNIASFYYSRMSHYVQSLHHEGIEDLAYLDQLTGLANRWSFEHWASKKLAEVHNLSSTTALVFLDIDDFKEINDTYGHEMGDRVLQSVSRRLKNNIRSRDRKSNSHDYSIARFAGDEFVILLYDVCNKQDLDGILNRICHLFQDGYAGSKQISCLTVSVGVALYPQDANNLCELTRCADKAMYSAKHAGKNQYQYYRGDQLCSVTEIEPSSEHNIRDLKKA